MMKGDLSHDFLYMVGVRAWMPLLGRFLSVSFVSLRDLEYLWGSRLIGLGERSNNTKAITLPPCLVTSVNYMPQHRWVWLLDIIWHFSNMKAFNGHQSLM